MFRILRFAMSAAVAACGWLMIQPAPATGHAPIVSAAAVGSATSVPWGWVDFCQRYAGECGSGPLPAEDIRLDEKALADLKRIDIWVNAHVAPVTDMEHWGVEDRWDLPIDGRGDCEDYALFKRKILIQMGYPRQALLMTVVHDGADEGHAILTVKTDRGDFALDNLNDSVRPWTDTGYAFVKRQSQEDPNVWVKILPATMASAAGNPAM